MTLFSRLIATGLVLRPRSRKPVFKWPFSSIRGWPINISAFSFVIRPYSMRLHAFHSLSCRSRRDGFTLLQITVVIGLLATFAALSVGQFGRMRASARRAECDVHLKSIVLAIDTFRQETGRLPATLIELKTNGYLTLDMIRCPADPDLEVKGSDANYASYADFYVLRDVMDDGELPTVVCPFHEKDGSRGVQGFKGGYTKSFATRPATLADVEGTVTVTRPGAGVLEIPASGRLEVRGGDRIQLGAGSATLTFADGSLATLNGGSEMSVLESYLESQDTDSIYTLVRQFAGTINYSVVPGNKFDVATPTATAGALGTKFTIQLVDAPTDMGAVTRPGPQAKQTVLTVTEHTVALTTAGRTIEVVEAEPAVRSDDPLNRLKPHAPRGYKNKKVKKIKKKED